jgi:hypothetical protein
MKSLFLFLSACLLVAGKIKSQKLWDGGGGNDRWGNAANWYPDGVPLVKEDVLLDNRFVKGNYRVVLPDTRVYPGNVEIRPAATTAGGSIPVIELILPTSNAFNNAFSLFDTMLMYEGAVFRHQGGARSEQIGFDRAFIFTGARWIHSSLAPDGYLYDIVPDRGVIEFNVPATTYAVKPVTAAALPSIVFNSTEAAARGLAVTYIIDEPGTSVYDSFYVKAGATVRFLDNAELWIQGGNLIVEGSLDWRDSSNVVGKIFFTPSLVGRDFCTLEGTGSIWMNDRFLIQVNYGTHLKLRRSLLLASPQNRLILNGAVVLETGNNTISGAGEFRMEPSSELRIGSPDGLWRSASLGTIQTAVRTFADSCIFEYNGSNVQHTGDGLPDSVRILRVNKPSGDLILTRPVYVRDSLKLIKGKINTSATALLTWSGKNNGFGNITNNYGNTYGWEQSFVNGPMAVTMKNSGQLCALPIGKENVFAPVILQKQVTSSAKYTAEYMPETPSFVSAVDPPLNHISRIEYWKIRATLPTITTATADDAVVHLSWRPLSRLGASFAERSHLRLAHFENSGSRLRWESVSSPAPLHEGSHGITQFVSDPVTDFSPESFTFGSISAFNPMVPLDITPAIRRNSPAAENTLVLYPNPAGSVLHVRIAASLYEIVNAAGQIIKKQINRQGNITTIDIGGLPAGVYYLRVYSNSQQNLYPFIKQ